jgi:DmsE family decaheme c-type cytochrome
MHTMQHMRLLRRLAVVFALLTSPATVTAQKQAEYAGSASCIDCHKKQVAQFSETTMGALMNNHPRTEHEKQSCEGCHGPAKQHAESGGEELGAMITFSRKSKTPVAERNARCLTCHEKTARTLWKGSTHEQRDVACTDCHTVMHEVSDRNNLRKPTTIETCGRCHAQKKAQMMRNAHMPLVEGKMECSSCHNPHGSANDKMLVASSVNETCYNCHAEKRGPFLWEHAPVVESCANCHDSHGGTHERMLKITRPRLCQQCHPLGHATTVRDPALPSALPFTFNKSCNNCHFNIHGSNHPAGAFFTR